MYHHELNELWLKQRRNDQNWHHQLVGSAVSLLHSIRGLLKPDPLTWKDLNSDIEHQYVEIVDFYGLDEPVQGVKDLSANDVGVLVYGIAVTFDHGPTSYPKHRIYIPVASRLQGSSPDYALFDRGKDSPDNDWHSDVDVFSKKLIDKLKSYLSHDAFDGFDKRQKFGFIK